jgi:hypothetical protein
MEWPPHLLSICDLTCIGLVELLEIPEVEALRARRGQPSTAAAAMIATAVARPAMLRPRVTLLGSGGRAQQLCRPVGDVLVDYHLVALGLHAGHRREVARPAGGEVKTRPEPGADQRPDH